MPQQRSRSDDADERRSSRTPERRAGGSRLFWLGSRLLVMAVLLAVVLFFAPLLVTSTGLWKSLLASAAPELAAHLQIQALSLSWLAPVEVRGLAVADESGPALAEVPVVRSQKTLLAMALNYRDVGTFEVEQPIVRVVLRATGSNIEDLLAKLPKSEGKSGGVGFGLLVTKGSVELDDQIAGQQWLLENLDVNLTATADQQLAGKVAAALRSRAAALGGGQIVAEFSQQPASASSAPLGAGQVQVALQGFPTDVAEGALRRFAADIRPRGLLTLQAAASWKGAGEIQLSVDHVASPGLSVAAPQLLGTDQPTIAIVAGQADVALAGKQALVRKLDLQTSVVDVAGKGAAGLGNLAADSVDLKARFNLAELARQLPATLRFKQDTQLHAGIAEVSLTSSSAADGRRWQGSLATRDLRGVAAGRPIQFERPLEIDFALRQTPQEFVIDSLQGQASFMKLAGRGSLAEGRITANADLDKLVVELGRLIDWGHTRLAGSIDADLRWKQDVATGWTASAGLLVQNFEMQAPGLTPWKEPQLRLTANVNGNLSGTALEQITAANLAIEAGADRLDAELTQSVRSPSLASVWPAKFTLRGDLASWTPRLQPFVPLGGWRMEGGVDVAGSARLSQKEGEFTQVSLQLAQLRIDGPTVAIREPVVKVETSGAWSQPKSTLTLGTTTLASSAIAFRADGVRLTAGQEPSLVGVIDLRGDLGRLSSWLVKGQQPRTSQLAGGLTGRLEIGYRGQSLAANWTADVENFKYLVAPPPPSPGAGPALASAAPAAAWQPVWEEPRVNFVGQGSFDPAAGVLKIERTSLATGIASFAAAGAVSKLGAAPEVDLAGEIAYDLALLTQQIQARAKAQAKSVAGVAPYGLDTLQLAGQQKRQFVLKGPLFAATGNLTPPQGRDPLARSVATATSVQGLAISEALTGEASLGWDGAQYVGLVAGKSDFHARLAGGILQIGPLDIPLAEGRLTAAPRMLLNDPAQSVVIDRGPLLQNVRISPEMCSLWLKFVAPLVADATRAEGKFSLTLEGASVPLSLPLASDVAGTLSIQSAQIGPGPLAQQYLGMANQVRALLQSTGGGAAGSDSDRGWVILPQQDVLFEVRSGTVLNRGLKMSVGDVVITTEGSVEIETQRINLLASVPLNDNWFKQKEGVYGVLKGQTLKIPVTGTLTQPRLDTRVLQNLGTQLAGSAVQGVITKQVERGQGLLNKELERGQGLLQNEIGQGLNRLFGPRTPTPQPATPQPR